MRSLSCHRQSLNYQRVIESTWCYKWNGGKKQAVSIVAILYSNRSDL
ncbi:hypothetical protein T4A_8556 [Trichinella pseudospiralis]|uniref:Uncharacterized protein n=1 Tax=Trichinella pseudospiralis TaxID=6337 RepID=A0A0V1C8M6_TRIPS|nr:hypothetical protein T4A_8556 [Trichinella pseudospiralis]